MKASRRQVLAMGAVSAAAIAATGCSGDTDVVSPTSPAEGTGSADSGPVTLEFWSWAAGMDAVVSAFNESQSEVTVKLSPSQSDQPGYQKLESAVASNTGPDIAQVEFMMVPSMAIAGALQDVTELAKTYADRYPEGAWAGAGFQGYQFGIPNDEGPMVTYYNRAVLSEIGSLIPATWEEYREVAEKLKTDKGAYLGTLLTKGPFVAALAIQNGAKWFDASNDRWTIRINDDATVEALDFWLQMAKDGVVNVDPGFNPGFWAMLDSGQVNSYTIGAWGYRGMLGNLKETVGDWHVAQAPQWSSTKASAPYGGSIWAITKNCEHPEAALAFADWVASNPESLNIQFENSGFYPSSGLTAGISGYDDPNEFFGGDALGPAFQEAASMVPTDWQWGPTMASVFTLIEDRLAAAVQSGSSAAMFAEVQAETVKKLKESGLEVAEG